MDIQAQAPFGSPANPAARMPSQTAPSVPPVTESDASGKPGADTRQTGHQTDNAAAARDIRAQHQRRVDPDLPTGPPPAFEISLLEVERDLQQVIARLEAARTRSLDAEGVRVRDTPQPDRPAPVAPTPTAALAPEDRVGVAQLDQPYDRPPVAPTTDTRI